MVVTRRRVVVLGSAVATGLVAGACRLVEFAAPPPDQADCNPSAQDGAALPQAIMRFDQTSTDFFAAPFPALGRPNGGVDAHDFPVNGPLLFRLRNMVIDGGYAISSTVFFELSGPALPGSLPPQFAPSSLDANAPVSSVLLFPRHAPFSPAPINVDVSNMDFSASDGTGDNHRYVLTILPVQGRPLLENTDYVAVVTARAAGQAPFVDAVCKNQTPPGLTPDLALEYKAAIDEDLSQLHLGCADIAALTLFHTSEPTAQLDAVQKLAHSDFNANEGACTFTLTREGDNSGPRCPKAPFCVYSGTVQMPVYQRGAPPYFPYFDWGGGWPTGPVPAPSASNAGCAGNLGSIPEPADGASWQPTWRTARVVVTIPHAPPPVRDDGGAAPGYPTVVFVRTGACGCTDPLVDRGPTLGPSCNETACRGPAEALQSVGFAGITVDGPLVGTSGTEPLEIDEDFGVFDFLNPVALRDNIRQSAVELTLVPDVLARVAIDLDQCEGTAGGKAVFDLAHLALFSHSMGSTISPLALAADPRYGAVILSGSGGSLIENALYKKEPLPINAAGSLFGYSAAACNLSARDPELALLQWAEEPADTESFVRRLVTDDRPDGATWSSPNARSVLMIQGLVDHYILPPIADVTTLGAGLSLGVGPNSCNGDPACDHEAVYGDVATPDYPALPKLLPLSGGEVLALADAGGNVAWPSAVPSPDAGPRNLTAVVVQHRIDQNLEPQACVVDGHEVIFESLLARHQYACFLHDFANDKTPQIRSGGDIFTPCTP